MRRHALILLVSTLAVVGCFGRDADGSAGTGAGDGGVTVTDGQTSREARGITIFGSVTMGPMCAVVTRESCPDEFLEGAELVLVDAAGDEVGRVVSNRDGRFALSLIPGEEYTIVPQPVEGLAAPRRSGLRIEGDGDPVDIVLRYDTGLR
jgi:hypothetical protein